jgi:hypothetical protein
LQDSKVLALDFSSSGFFKKSKPKGFNGNLALDYFTAKAEALDVSKAPANALDGNAAPAKAEVLDGRAVSNCYYAFSPTSSVKPKSSKMV